MPTERPRDRAIERQVQERLRRLQRRLGEDFLRIRIDAAATKAQVGSAAGVDRTFYGRIESGDAHPSLETLVALSIALGAELSIRIYPGIGPVLTDRHQARMEEAFLRELHPVWRPHLEVGVTRPVRGVIDSVLERTDVPLLVLTEFESSLPRLEQQIRWAGEKANAIWSSELIGEGPRPAVSRLLVLRSTAATRAIATRFETMLRTAYPCRTREAIDALMHGSAWPGDSMIWVRIDGDHVRILDRPPTGVAVGR